MINRRHFMGTLATATAALGLPAMSFAQSAGNDRKFIFVFADGGWDPLCVFAPKFGARHIDMEPDATAYTLAGHTLVDHPQRPNVRRFFERYGRDVAIINGLSTRSVSHEVCAAVATTGGTSAQTPDWASLVAQGGASDYSVPSLVLGGPSFPGNLESLVSRAGANGQLEMLLQSGLSDLTDGEAESELTGFAARLDRFVGGRASRYSGGRRNRRARLARDLEASVRRVTELKAVNGDLSFEADVGADQVNAAVAALSLGLSRSVSVVDASEWDSHEDNTDQIAAFDGLFASLSNLMRQLAETPAQSGRPLIEETTVVVYSEMGRTPLYNGTGGRDHWPYTSVMMMGAGIKGGHTLGAFDDAFTGVGFDPVTGAPNPMELGVPSKDLGATLVHMAGLNAGTQVPGGRIIRAVLA